METENIYFRKNEKNMKVIGKSWKETGKNIKRKKYIE